jgi:YfiH family protein
VHLLEVDLGRRVRAGFTRRAGGVSASPYDGFDLALHVGDDPEAVAANRGELAAWAGAPVVFGRQVHGVRVLRVDSTDQTPLDPRREDIGLDGGCDALVAIHPGRALGVLVADCVPVLLADPRAGVVGVAHAGRVGLLAGVLEAVLAEMAHTGARIDHVQVALGPAAGPCCYEVPASMRAEAGAQLGSLPATTSWGTPSLDLRAGCRERLRAAGVASVQVVGGCTIEDPASYSYRRGSPTGRFAGVVRLLP